MDPLTRRQFLRAAGSALAAGALTQALPWTRLPFRFDGTEARDGTPFAIGSGLPADKVFPQSVASGDPTHTGAVVWTRVAPDRLRDGGELGLEVATDEEMTDVVYRTVVPATEIRAEHAHTVRVDLDGLLLPDRHYHYRFIYDGTATRTGRLRTLPETDTDIPRLRLALVTCNNFQNGYYPAFGHIAQEDVDYLVHLGDFIYEYNGARSYNGKHFPGREIDLPSGAPRMESREDLDYMWGKVRGDVHMMAALERHTLIATWDDHEIANDRSFDYGKGHHIGDPDFRLNDDAERIDRFFRDGAQAYFDWVPVRIGIDKDAEDPLQVIKLYRSFTFGRLAQMWMLDERWYRAPALGGAMSASQESWDQTNDRRLSPDQTMLGPEQKEWLFAGLRGSRAQWKVLGQQVQMSPLAATLPGTSVFINLDAWDGYEYERQELTGVLGEVEGAVVLTGDLHTFLVGYVKRDYNTQGVEPAGNRVAVEFMTPAVTSAGLGEIIEQQTGKPLAPGDDEALENVVLAGNPHLKMFNSTRHGYSVVEFTKTTARYSAFVVDKAQSGVAGNRRLVAVYETHAGSVQLQEKYRASPSGMTPLGLLGLAGDLDPRREGVPMDATAARAAGYIVTRDVKDVGPALAKSMGRPACGMARVNP